MKAFHAYDIRGVWLRDFNLEDVYKVGYHLVHLLGVEKVLVGRDARTSSPDIRKALCEGINDAGANVYDLGLATTPMVYFATVAYGFDASVQITASHNSKEYNGLKVSRGGAVPVGYDSGLKQIEERMGKEPIIKAKKRGRILSLEIREKYIAFLRRFIEDWSNISIAADCSNGMAGLLIKSLLPESTSYLYDELDGTFPNHEANPLIADNQRDLIKHMRGGGYDIGFLFDGDADRVVCIDEKGRYIPPDIMIIVLGQHFLIPKPVNPIKVLVDIRTSKSVDAALIPMGAEIIHWKVGRAFMASKLREIDGLFGGELAGHFYFKDFFYSDSGLLAAIQFANVVAKLKREGKTLSEFVDSVTLYPNTGELNYSIGDKEAAMEAVKEYFLSKEEPTQILDFDGYRIEFKDWWFSIRPSNTEPLLRFIAEADTQQLLDEKVAKVRRILVKFA